MSIDEGKLIQACKNGEIEAFEALVDAYQSKVYSIAFHMLGHEQDAQDAAQEAFLKAYRYIGDFKQTSGFYTWIYRITYNVCLDMIRKRGKAQTTSIDKNYVDASGDEMVFQVEDPAQGPEEKAVRAETAVLMREAIGKLKESYRVIVIMRDIQDMTYDQIAEALEISVGTVKSRLSRARESLKKIIIRYYPELFQ